jgi:flagellar assembly protein FliH
MVLEVVRGALRRLVERHTVTILVNPDDLELVREAADSLQGSLGGIEKLDVQAERRVGRGGAILRTADGELDARIASQLERVRETVESELGG